MLKKMTIRNISAAGLIVVPIILSGCSGFSSQSMEIDPPPAQIEAEMLQSMNGSAPQATKEQLTPTSTVYLADQHGLLAPVSIGLPPMDNKDNMLMRQSLEAMVKDGPYAGYLPEGFSGVLPEGTEVKMVSVEKDSKLAVVEFSKSFTEYDASNERKMLEAVTWTLTSDPNIEQVQFWVEGKKITEMPLNHTPLDQNLGRSMGINLEKGDGASYTHSSSVTMYFSSESPAGIQYYVPITRLVVPGQDTLHAALSELIRGPQPRGGLESVMTTGTSLQSVKSAKDGTVTVSLKEDMFIKGEKVPSQLLQSVVLTVTENSGNNKVIIQLNGDSNVIGDDNQNYSEPVSRPQYINEIPL
ncbi:GerMN domain-containing protein [Paenibacillus sp. FA6]|uniref:GerMN domain-containing protein n=1 Tax=Paenibacillus sp. FA6 TaxID=3413029 RepID=UPI003F65C6C4